MSRGFFITGTDTSVGKTVVACGLAAAFKKSDLNVGVMKPAETGCQNVQGHLVPPDATNLKRAAGSDQSIESICPYRLGVPAAPSVAAAKAGTRIQPELLVRLCQDMGLAHDLMLVEGAGGLMVPLVGNYTYADLARELGLGVIVVVGNRLGAVNHAILTMEHASCLGLNVCGYILNELQSERTPATTTNAETLDELTQVQCLGRIPFLRPDKDRTPPEQRKDLGDLFIRYVEIGYLKGMM